ncbi:MAG: hypothetical protein EBT79_08350 [Actinobacteria bacterium]|nr:hypothetical protein [Actinomycetota bacterium]
MNPTLQHQLRMLQAWLESEEARRYGSIFARRASLNDDGDDIIAEAFLRVTDAMSRRTEPHPSMTSPQDAARYGMRVLDNICRDRARARRRLAETSLAGTESLEALPPDGHPLGLVDGPEFLEKLLRAVGSRAEQGFVCPGCSNPVVVAMALEVVHLALSGAPVEGTGRTWLDRLLHTALINVEGDLGRSEVAQNQRKSRCGRCAVELLEAGARDVLGDTR